MVVWKFSGPLAQLVEQLTVNPFRRVLQRSAPKRTTTQNASVYADLVRFGPRRIARQNENPTDTNFSREPLRRMLEH